MPAHELFTPGIAFDRPRLPAPRVSTIWLRRLVVFVTCALALNALMGDRGLMETLKARRQRLSATAALADLKRHNAALVMQADRLRTDGGTIEHIARSELGLVRRGEVLVVLRNAPSR